MSKAVVSEDREDWDDTHASGLGNCVEMTGDSAEGPSSYRAVLSRFILNTVSLRYLENNHYQAE